jgi:hypothetical protein
MRVCGSKVHASNGANFSATPRVKADALFFRLTIKNVFITGESEMRKPVVAAQKTMR